MQTNNQNQNVLNSPIIAISIIYIFKGLGFLGVLAVGDILSIIFNLIIFIPYSLSVFWAFKGMLKKLFYLYKRALIILFILSIVSTILRIISIIVLISYDAETNNEKTAKKIALALYIIGFFFDWILTVVLYLYKKKIENYCETPPVVPSESTANTSLVK